MFGSYDVIRLERRLNVRKKHFLYGPSSRLIRALLYTCQGNLTVLELAVRFDIMFTSYVIVTLIYHSENMVTA